MADCGAGGCANFEAAGANWFKIDEAGQTGNGWEQAALSESSPLHALHGISVFTLYLPFFQCLVPLPRSGFPATSLPETTLFAMRSLLCT